MHRNIVVCSDNAQKHSNIALVIIAQKHSNRENHISSSNTL